MPVVRRDARNTELDRSTQPADNTSILVLCKRPTGFGYDVPLRSRSQNCISQSGVVRGIKHRKLRRIDLCMANSSALARNDPTLLAKNYQHHTKLVTLLPVGNSAFLPRAKSRANQGPSASARECLGRPGRFFSEMNALDAPSARMTENQPARLRRG